MTDPADFIYMARAIQLAEKGLFTTDPNPRVGCVLVKEGKIVGEGWHEFAGEPHAEINALRQAGKQAAGATVYVTLEPCSHFGRTPPCSDALVKAGVKRVVAAMQDPNPLVSGKGLKQLAEAGIAVQHGVLTAEAEQLNPGFIKRMRHGLPLVRCKLAMSLDGRTAMASGESKWITGEAARLDVQRLRARSTAIMTGVGTVLTDDPSLTVRMEQAAKAPNQPLRIVVDSRLRMPPTAKMLKLPGETHIYTINAAQEYVRPVKTAGAKIHTMPATGNRVDLHAVLNHLGQLSVNEVLLEAGPTLSGAMLKAGLVDEIVVYMAPKLMGNAARGLFNLPGLKKMSQAINLHVDDIRAVGSDWKIVLRPKD
jgi:diaminohydroxyphosphoribosylaminopyrimidine deaminase/5-amino-6-(5-phosphoribosylamino)uracil reductase